MSDEPPPRVGVRRSPSPQRRRAPVRTDLDEQTEVGQLLLRGLLRAQLGQALRTALLVATPLVVLPLLFALVPASRTATVAGVPLPWLLLGVLAFPLIVTAGAWHLVRAERLEQEFSELVHRG